MPDKSPLNIKIMSIDSYIKDKDILEVTSPFAKASDGSLDEDGLFSETIFGEYASSDRLATFGYISLNCKIIHPRLFQSIMRLKRFYKELCSGKTYAIWNDTLKDFENALEGDPGANTGYNFFIKHVSDIKFKETDSLSRKTRIKVIEKYKDRLFIDKYLVLPAGLRDINLEEAYSATEEINKLYSGLMHLASGIDPKSASNPIFDSLRYAIQRKAVAIYEYIKNITDKKGGFFQKKYSRRAIALGTRNVITPADMSPPSTDHPQAIRSDETAMPLFQTMKGCQPLVAYQLKLLFFNSVIEEGAAKIGAIHKSSHVIQYINVSVDEKDKFLTSEGIASMISRYRDPNNRHLPVTILDDADKSYYLYMTYRDGDQVFLFRSKSDFVKLLEQDGRKFDKKKMNPLTYAEMFYIATYFAVKGKHVLTTRYPITGPESVYPSKVHLISTDVSDVIELKDSSNMKAPGTMFPHYPRYGQISQDSASPHPSMLKPLGGD